MPKKILLLDDDAIIRMAALGILAAEPDWEITEAERASQALELFAGGYRPDLCMLDVCMPDMSGLDFARQVRADPQMRYLKIVVTSGINDRAVIIEFARLKVSGFLPKPYGAEKTLAVLRPLLAAPSAVG